MAFTTSNRLLILLLAFMLPLNWNTQAAELTITPNAFVSYRDFEYSVGSGGIDNNLYSVGMGLTATYGRFYLDLSGEKNPTSGKEPTATSTAYFEREDAAVSLGYGVNESISVFAGYKYGETRIVSPPSAITFGSQVRLQGRGLFVGAGAGWAVNDTNLVSFSAAYAMMRAEYEDSALERNVRGDASGTSLGVRWKGLLSKQLSYDVSLIRHDYYYESFDLLLLDISEQILSLRLGLAYQW
jgi:hypothetical protein